MSKEEAIKACERIMRHTPGPWGIYSDSPDTSVYCDDSLGSRIADCSSQGLPTIIRMEQQQANAKLIAAAPDMLELLIKIADDPNLDWSGEAADLVVKATT